MLPFCQRAPESWLVHASTGAVFVGADDFGSIAITPCGEMDMASAPTLLGALRQAIAQQPSRIMLDLSSVAFLDSKRCDALAVGWSEARAAGIRVALCEEMVSIVRRVLAITMLLPLFDPA